MLRLSREWKRLLILYIGLFIASIPAGLARPALAFHLRYDLTASVIATASITSSFMAGRAIASLASGFIGELAPWAKRLIVGLGIAGIGILLLVIIPLLTRAEIVLAVTALWGALGGFTWPTLQVAVSEMGGRRSGAALSLYYAIASLGISLGNWLFGYLHITYILMIKISGISLILSSPIIALSITNTGRSKQAGLRRAIARIWDPIILWVIITAFGIGLLNGVMREYFYIYSHELFGLSKSDLGDVLMAGGLFGVLLSLIVGTLSDKYGIPRMLSLILILTITGGLLVGNPLENSILLLSIGYILAAGGARSSMPLTRNAAIAGGIGGAMVVGASNTASSLGMLIGPPIAGFTYESSRSYAGIPFIISSIILTVILLIYLIIKYKGSS